MFSGRCSGYFRCTRRQYSTGSKPVVVVQGGVGQLGRDIVSKFKANNWIVVSIDTMRNDKASKCFVLGRNQTEDAKAIVEYLQANSVNRPFTFLNSCFQNQTQ